MAMRAFEQCERVAELIVVARPADHDAIRETAEKAGITKLHAVVEGGSTRQESVMCGLHALSKTTTMLAIHDGARPLVLPAQIAQVIQDASIFGGATLGVPVKDTIKVVNDNLIRTRPTVRTSISLRHRRYSNGSSILRRSRLHGSTD